MVLVTDTDADEYRSYLEKRGSGFVEYDKRNRRQPVATYTNNKYTINAGYYDYESSARIIIEPLSPSVSSPTMFTCGDHLQITAQSQYKK